MENQKINYQKILDKTLSNLGEQKSLLLHACCAPCSSYVLEYLSCFFNITIFYYNPNIHPKAEYERRLKELEDFLPRFECAKNVALVKETYEPEDFFQATNVRAEPELQTEREMGERCRRCYEFRMKKAWDYAENHGFDYFTTTLSISPHKDSEKINKIGAELQAKSAGKTQYLFSDFKKKAGFLRSLEISQEFGLYRQDYCGCVFSMRKSEDSETSGNR